MMASVSTLARSSGATRPVSVRNGCMSTLVRRALFSSESTHVDEMSRDGGCRRHRRAHQVRAAARTLAAFEIAVGRRRAALAGPQSVVVHPQAHRAPGLAPFETCGGEDAV